MCKTKPLYYAKDKQENMNKSLGSSYEKSSKEILYTCMFRLSREEEL